VHVTDVVATYVLAELADRLQEREDLDVTNRPADLGDHDVDVFCTEATDAQFDLVGDVGDHLDGLAQVLTPAFLGDDGLVNGTGRGIGVARQGLVDEALIVAQVKVGLSAVFSDEDLAVLERGSSCPGRR
jgi:hypothetical protein